MTGSLTGWLHVWRLNSSTEGGQTLRKKWTSTTCLPVALMSTPFMFYRSGAQGEYWAGRTPPPNNSPPNMATANFVMAEGCGLNGTAVAAVSSTNSVPHAFFPRVAIGCRLSLKIDWNLSPFWEGSLSVATWYDKVWIGGTASGEYLYRSVVWSCYWMILICNLGLFVIFARLFASFSLTGTLCVCY